MNTAHLSLTLLLMATVATAACNQDSTTSPSTTTTTTTTTTAASPTVTDSFSGTLAVRGRQYFLFTVEQYGTINATLVSVDGVGVPTTVQLRLGVGGVSETTTEAGTETTCSFTSSSLASPGPSAQVTTTFEAGTYCVGVSDVGNLFGPATVTVTVAHP